VAGLESIQFGFADAQTERSRAPELLLDGFLDEGNVMDEALAGWPFLFLGYKGSGKTAIVERAKLLARDDPALCVTAATLEEFSYPDFKTFAGGSGDFQSRYPPAWAWSLLLLLIQSFEADEGARSVSDPYYAKVVSGLEALELMPVPELNQLVQRTSKQQFKVGIPKFLELMGERGSESQDLQLAQMVRVLREATRRFRSQSRHVVFLDGLDDVLTAQELQFEVISALITEVARLNNDLQGDAVPAKFVVVCRTDIFDRLPGANLNKIRQDSALALNWYHDLQDPAGSRLHALINLRATRSLGREVNVFDAYLPERIDRRPAVRHLFDHTRHTPRDALQLMRALQAVAVRDPRRRLTEAQVRAGLKEYSREYFVRELRDELHGYLKRSEIDTAISLFNSLQTDRFTVESLNQQVERLRLPAIDVTNLLSTLFECGVVGMYDEGPGGARRYTFKFRNRNAIPILSSTFVLHRGSHKAFGIDRAR
jgi:hypothetical protein